MVSRCISETVLDSDIVTMVRLLGNRSLLSSHVTSDDLELYLSVITADANNFVVIT